jgi:quercetin dioxygenase-like cupin family protein
MNRLAIGFAAALFVPLAAAQAVVKPAPDIKWADAGIPGVATAAVDGDMGKGASRFYLRYASGFVAPPHHHSPDHFVTTVTGNLVLIVDGKEHKLPPGSFFSLKRKARHGARCEGAQDCVMFIDAKGKWDVVAAK